MTRIWDNGGRLHLKAVSSKHPTADARRRTGESGEAAEMTGAADLELRYLRGGLHVRCSGSSPGPLRGPSPVRSDSCD